MLLVLVLLWVLGANARVPEGASQYAPPPTPRPGELSISFNSADLSSRLGMPVQVVPNQFFVDDVSGHVELREGQAIVVQGDARTRAALQSLLDHELAQRGITYVRSATLTQDQLLLIGR